MPRNETKARIAANNNTLVENSSEGSYIVAVNFENKVFYNSSMKIELVYHILIFLHGFPILFVGKQYHRNECIIHLCNILVWLSVIYCITMNVLNSVCILSFILLLIKASVGTSHTTQESRSLRVTKLDLVGSVSQPFGSTDTCVLNNKCIMSFA